ncbi:hypothetical protein [Ectobacillus ponti]|uniref:Uncharacterized protein n=1 Tax=Ectobacillus ponti TaxID=2961894 RepID=A0AA41XA90_9BACI|nr:hypothetical protein [Ectobacillus ponti]MCP8969195.1 hypothetical protein [Ectobacillus ponti]
MSVSSIGTKAGSVNCGQEEISIYLLPALKQSKEEQTAEEVKDMAKRTSNDSKMQELQKSSQQMNREKQPGYGDKKLEGPDKPSV